MDSSFVSAGSIVSWTWSFGNGDSSNFQNPVYSYSEPGTYTVTLTVVTAAGCEDTYTFSYTVIPRDVIIPNVFSPGNSDGSNDKFEITFIEYYPNSVLTIFDRWGNVVYEKSDYQNTWDGTHYKNGKDLSSGTYFYVLQLSDGKTFNGTVTIYNK
jgi:gliding motility-associated-like protein